MGPRTLKVVKSNFELDEEAVKIALFRDEAGRICGWFIGPLHFEGDHCALPYLPRSKKVLGSVAIIRAIEQAEHLQLPLCLVDPDDLWGSTWAGVGPID